MPVYRVSSLSDLGRAVRAQRPTHVISLIDPDMQPPRLPSHLAIKHTVLHLNDVDRTAEGSGLKGDPSQEHVEMLVRLGRSFDVTDRALFHCVAGRRRSPAAALICDLSSRLANGAKADKSLVEAAHGDLIGSCPKADPNRAMLEIADGMMGFQGALSSFRPARYLTLDLD